MVFTISIIIMFLVVKILLRNEYISFRHSSPNEETELKTNMPLALHLRGKDIRRLKTLL